MEEVLERWRSEKTAAFLSSAVDAVESDKKRVKLSGRRAVSENAIVVPAGTSMNGTLRDGKPGIYYTTNYSMVGASAVGQQVIMDGLNDQGLSFGPFCFPGFAEYPAPSAPWPSPERSPIRERR